jgi:hypothetical protein
MQNARKVQEAGAQLASSAFYPSGWYRATVPGTVLSTLVDNGVYPDPMYGENNRPEIIPESLSRMDWWYRSTVSIPADFAGKAVWLNFDGVNYAAEVWVNGTRVGTMRGAFVRGRFDISPYVRTGHDAVIAVRVSPQPHPGPSHEHTILDGMGKNGGISAVDGATFLCTIAWDWIPSIRDRDTGLWQKVFLSASGPVLVRDPLVTTDLPLPRTDSADVKVSATLANQTDHPVTGSLSGRFGAVTFERNVELAPRSEQIVSFTPEDTPQLRVANPRLWWPNGYGPQNLYTLHLSFSTGGAVSDASETSFGIRKITYTDPSSDNLILVVNGIRIFAKGGDWGMDEAMKRIPRARLEAQIRMHQIANYTIIRNWVGQSTSEDFYDLCDKYGILVWDEFFQPNPGDGPNPTDLPTYVANVRDKLLRFRNHPSIALWCARNEGYPPKEIDAALRQLLAELEPVRHYQPSSTDGKGVVSHGPYRWRTPRSFYEYSDTEAFKTEIGSMSVPTLESIQGMMPRRDWDSINDDWAEHDFARGAQAGDKYPEILAARYGPIANLADFVRKAQMMNYEAFRAMYEGRQAKMFSVTTGVITWMSNPAQPSFVWQLYHHDLEPNSALFAVRAACEPVHIQWNEANGTIQVINNRATALRGASAAVAFYNLDGSSPGRLTFPVDAAASGVTTYPALQLPAGLSSVYFVQLQLTGPDAQLISRNFYWRGAGKSVDSLGALEELPTIALEARVTRHDTEGKTFLDVKLKNPSSTVVLASHLQLHRERSGTRVLPVYYTDNYLDLAPGEERTVAIECAASDLGGEQPLVLVDGWNASVRPFRDANAAVQTNQNAQVSSWPATGLEVKPGRKSG